MKTSHWLLGALLAGSVVVLEGCGSQGQYVIPNVEPVVKQKANADDDLLEDIEGGDDKKAGGNADAKPADDGKGAAPAKK